MARILFLGVTPFGATPRAVTRADRGDTAARDETATTYPHCGQTDCTATAWSLVAAWQAPAGPAQHLLAECTAVWG